MMTEFFDNDQKKEIDDRNAEKFKYIFSTNAFTDKTFVKSGGITPDPKILDLIKEIGNSKNDIKNIVINHGHFLHNRMGTLLNKNERPESPVTSTDFKPGELVGYTKDGNNYYVSMVYNVYADALTAPLVMEKLDSELTDVERVEKALKNALPKAGVPISPQPLVSITESKSGLLELIIVLKDKNNNVIKTTIEDVNFGSIIKLNDKIKQIYKPNIKIADEDLIETYEINF